jgi:hypothetical protein
LQWLFVAGNGVHPAHGLLKKLPFRRQQKGTATKLLLLHFAVRYKYHLP